MTYLIGSDPEAFAITPDGSRLYASNEDGGTATAIDDPPWQVRDWVTTAAGRASHLGTAIECVLCERSNAADSHFSIVIPT